MAVSFKFKLRKDGRFTGEWLKRDYLPCEGEKIVLPDKTYIVDKAIQRKNNIYTLEVREEIKTPIVVKEKSKNRFQRLWEVIHG